MKFSYLLLALPIATTYGYACGLHQTAGFNFITEPGSLAVFENVIEMRKTDPFAAIDLQQLGRPSPFINALNQPYNNKIAFTIFEAIKGHYNEVDLAAQITIEPRETGITENDLLLITDSGVLDALGYHRLSWQQAKALGLVKINGKTIESEKLDQWFTVMFPATR
ncbi:hypothetical protein GCM10007916_31850 [Psychromonas marina]|uniref:Uncharacterized protein n=1 Tax=Psychromonas marina TaxID=88364 RepID=A0ABQ6E4M6_9GAMM|nr:hypothetical protein [Psychromonas marina]GLS92115.1 hypothetical protein GCM10007916_31850 [Psychromonas marina]